MNLDRLNQWLTLAANLGVLVGLIFLIAELNQSNRIAKYSAESTRRTQFLDMNTSRIQNPEIIAKLMQPNPELNDIEWVQAVYTARQQVNTWIDAENAVMNGLLSQMTYQEIFADIDVIVSEMPGLIPAFEYLFEAYHVDENAELETIAHLFNAVQKLKNTPADDPLKMPRELDTVDDGRAPIQSLFEAFSTLRERGWLLDVVTGSRPDGTSRSLPIVSLRTAEAGPAIWIFSGIHGEEPAGPNAIANVIDAVAEAGARHPVVLIPLANPQGYVRNWRYLNTPVWSEEIEGQSVGDSSHMLLDPDSPGNARAAAASSSEADAITRYILRMMRDYPPVASFDLHEDDEIHEGYVYSQGKRGSDEPLARLAVEKLLESGVSIKMDGQTRFEEKIEAGIIGPVVDSSIDELMSAHQIMFDGATTAGPAAPVVLVLETPSQSLPLATRIAAQEAVLAGLLRAAVAAPDLTKRAGEP